MTMREQTTEGNGEKQREESGLPNKTHEVAEQVRQAALERVDSVRQSTQSAKQQAAERVRKLGQTIRKVGEHLRVEDQNYVAQKATDASQRLDQFADYVNGAELATLLRDTGNLARKSPAVFFGSAFAIGLAAGRFLRTGSSSAQSPGSQSDAPQSQQRATQSSSSSQAGRGKSSTRPNQSRSGASQ